MIIFKSPRERGEDGGAESDFSPLTALINPEFEPVQDELRLAGKVACRSLGSLVPSSVLPHRLSRYPLNGQEVAGEATNFHARVVQHEIDHLDGVLFPMRMTDLSLLSFNEELKVSMEHASAQATADANEENLPS